MKTKISVFLAALIMLGSFVVPTGALEISEQKGSGVSAEESTDKTTSENVETAIPSESSEATKTTEATEITAPTEATEVTEPTTVTEETEPEYIPVTHIRLEKNALTLYRGGKYRIYVDIENAKGKITYTSSKKSVATVSANGKVTAKKKGKATITVKNNGVTAKLTVTVINPKLNVKSKTLYKGDSFTLIITGKEGKTTFTSSNPKVATVTKSGKVKAKKKGTAKITVKTNNGYKLNCTVKVKNKGLFNKVKVYYKQLKKKLTLNVGQELENYRLVERLRDNLNLEADKHTRAITAFYVGKTKISKTQYLKLLNQLKAKETFYYTADKPELFTVDKYGYISRAKKPGKATLTVHCYKKNFKVKVTIKKVKETTYKGKKAKAVYSMKEMYNTLIDLGYNYALKGKKLPYSYVVGYFKYRPYLYREIQDMAGAEIANTEHANPTYVIGGYILGYDTTSAIDLYETKFDGLNVLEVSDGGGGFFGGNTKSNYKEAQEIFEYFHIDRMTEDYEKLIAIRYWVELAKKDLLPKDKARVLRGYASSGNCASRACVAEYLCTVAGVPCVCAVDDEGEEVRSHAETVAGHMWNIVYIQGKWYFTDTDYCTSVILESAETLHYCSDLDLLSTTGHNSYSYYFHWAPCSSYFKKSMLTKKGRPISPKQYWSAREKCSGENKYEMRLAFIEETYDDYLDNSKKVPDALSGERNWELIHM